MKFTYAWLQDYLTLTDANLNSVVNGLLQIGLEVENITDYTTELQAFTVAEILTAKPHPNADKLKACEVKTQDGIKQVVCGAPNARAGIKVIYAAEGVFVKGAGITIKKTAIRGVESFGMMVSEAELQLSSEHSGIIEVDNQFEVGEEASVALGLNDITIDVAVTPNLGFLLGVKAIARELASLGLGEFKQNGRWQQYLTNLPQLDNKGGVELKVDNHISDSFNIAVIEGVNNNITTPQWIAQRLKMIGQRSISALVDITNYLLVDLNHPTHVYDQQTLGKDITVKYGVDGDTCKALNDEEYRELQDIPVITSNNQVIALAGVMGGLNYSATSNTTNVVLECAVFNPSDIVSSTKKLKLNSDSSYRFARGVSNYDIIEAVTITSNLMAGLCGGKIKGLATHHTHEIKPLVLKCNIQEINHMLGTAFTEDEIVNFLTKANFVIESKKHELITVKPPIYRNDIHTIEDIADVVMKLYGIDNIIEAKIDFAMATQNFDYDFERLIISKRSLAHQGMVESINMSFISVEMAQLFDVYKAELELSNPISKDLAVMRGSLIPSLMLNVVKNSRQGFSNLSIFEVANTYSGLEPEQSYRRASGVLCGYSEYKNWQHKDQTVDVFEAKTKLFKLLEDLGTDPRKLLVTKDELPKFYHPGKAGGLWLGRTPLAFFGEIHPSVLKELNLTNKVVAFELLLINLPAVKVKSSILPAKHFSSRMPIFRDFAFYVKTQVKAREITKLVSAVNKQLITEVRIFDVFVKDIADTEKSIAFTITIEPQDNTLTDNDINNISNKIISEISNKLGGRLRDS